jgi:hypothetical protein
MELLTKTLFSKYDLTDQEKLEIKIYYHLGIIEYLSVLYYGEVNGFPTTQRYLLN